MTLWGLHRHTYLGHFCVAMETEKKAELVRLLKVLPPVEFCCVYGSALHPNNSDKNLKMNRDHYASWMVHLGGAKLITEVADEIGVGVHFNPFVTWEDKMFKYGVVRMDDLVRDVLNWERFYLSGRLQKPVHILVDNLAMGNLNSVNLRAATSAALLLSPSKFSEFMQENLYAKICSLSYMGDLRMLFAEDKNKVEKIVQGQFELFQTMYKPFLEEYAAKDLLTFSSSAGNQVNFSQDCGLSAASSLVSCLPPTVRGEMALKLGEKKKRSESGQVTREVVISSRKEAAECMQKIVRHRVMVSSARQAVSGLLTAGAVRGVRYLSNKMHKAWKSWI
ncbi:phosphatidate cytidylyltransferase, mitochondrial isoform X4 [Camellia sinensis]|uniref:phosphatidate cytidylyltransferase, mitochondrial isoform X4 n=2 Tax=Camellia sinensis TaxID=4442 RepID=UPI001036BBDE|nr:phosphatidate cytidylyltransferase, mitochondrial isoform X4 [Camellia sinensis]